MSQHFLASIFVMVTTAASGQDMQIDKGNQIITPDMQTLALQIGGRTQPQPLDLLPQGAVSYSHEWPGVYFETAFSGGAVFLKFSDSANEYRLWIDDLPSITLAQPGAVEVAVTGLKAGTHHARLEKVTESVWLLGAFDGFYAPKAMDAEPLEKRTHQIEFIGDSDMTGYGIRSAKQQCTQEQVRLTSDSQIAYPALVAKSLNADYQINAISGRGLVRNYGGGSDHAMSRVYANTLPDVNDDTNTFPYFDDQWTPDLIVVGLGDNDFSTPLLPSEPWPTHDALITDFIENYKTLLLTLHQTSPDAALIILEVEPTILTETERARLSEGMQTAVLTVAKQAGFRSVDMVSIADLSPERTACDYHASQADHQRRADWFVGFIDANPDLFMSR